MKIQSLTACLFIFSFFPQSSLGQTKDITNHPDIKSNLELVDVWLQSQIDHGRLKGISVAVVVDQEVIYAKGFGVADPSSGELASPETVYRLGSHSKLLLQSRS